MVGGDMPHLFQAVPFIAEVRIIVMQIRDAARFLRAATEFPDIVADGGAGDQRQVHFHAGQAELAGHIGRHVMHAAHMGQGIKRRDIAGYPHELVDIAVIDQVFQTLILGKSPPVSHLVRQHKDVAPRIVRKGFLFIAVAAPQDLQEKQASFPEGFILAVVPLLGFRKELGEHIIHDVARPALRRFPAQIPHVFFRDLADPDAVKAAVCLTAVSRKTAGHLLGQTGSQEFFHLLFAKTEAEQEAVVQHRLPENGIAVVRFSYVLIHLNQLSLILALAARRRFPPAALRSAGRTRCRWRRH